MKYTFRVETTNAASPGLLDDNPIGSPAELPGIGDVIFLPGSVEPMEVKWRDFVYNGGMTTCTVHLRVEPA